MKFCPNCGMQLTENVRFCANCGFPIENAQQPNQQAAYEQPQYTQAPGQPPYGAPAEPQSTKSRLVTLLLAVFVGGFGVHHFYVGNTGKGVLYIFTAGLFGIGVLIDIIHIATGDFKDSDGLPVLNWDM